MSVTRSAKRYWFSMFSDEELARIGSEFIGRPVRSEAIAQQRLALLASAKRSRV